MHEFRPADVIERDAGLAASLGEGDAAALDELVERYGRAVGAVVAGPDSVIEVFTRVWDARLEVEPGTDFAPWVGALAAQVAGRTPGDVEATWATAMAVDAVADDVRADLRTFHVDGAELADGADRHELRLRRRLAHLGDDELVATALRDPAPWSDPPTDLVERVRANVIGDRASRSGGTDVGDAGADLDDEPSRPPSRVTRALRPVLLGLAGAAAVLFVAIIALSAASGSVAPAAFTADLTPTGAILDVEGGEVTVTEGSAGLVIALDASTLPRRGGDQFYEGVLVLRGGTEVSAGTFNEGVSVTLTAGVDLARVETFNVVARSIGSDAAEIVLKLDVPAA